MNEESRAAYIIAQSALLNAEIAMMQAANQDRLGRGCGIAYGENEFFAVFSRYDVVIGHNPCIAWLRGD